MATMISTAAQSHQQQQHNHMNNSSTITSTTAAQSHLPHLSHASPFNSRREGRLVAKCIMRAWRTCVCERKMGCSVNAIAEVQHSSHVTRHTSHVTRHTSHVTRHRCCWELGGRAGLGIGSLEVKRRPLVRAAACSTSHVTRHTSHVTRHTSHVARHTSHVTGHARRQNSSSSRCTP